MLDNLRPTTELSIIKPGIMLIYNYGAFRVLYIYKTSNNAANFQSKKVWLGLLLTGGFGNLTDLKTKENSSP